MVATFGVVVVGDDRGLDADPSQQVEAVSPERLVPALVDLVDGYGRHAEGECGGRGEHDYASLLEFGSERAGDGGATPLLDRVGR